MDRRRRAAVAIAHKILISAYHMLSTARPYNELGESYLDQIAQQKVSTNLIRRLERLGFDVTIKPKAA